MTTIYDHETTCSVCGTVHSFPTIVSTNQMGAPDLDTRPAEMARSTLPFQIQRCKTCGYCSSDISDALCTERKVLDSPVYLDQLNSSDNPELANTFACSGLIYQACTQPEVAGWDAGNTKPSDDRGLFLLLAISSLISLLISNR